MAIRRALPSRSVDIVIVESDTYVMDIASSAHIIKGVDAEVINEFRRVDPQTGVPSQSPHAVEQSRVRIITEWKDVN